MVIVEMVFYVGIKYVLISIFSKGMLTLDPIVGRIGYIKEEGNSNSTMVINSNEIEVLGNL